MTSPDHTPIPDGFKRCSKCGEIKPISAFAHDSSVKSGLRARCRACDSLRHRQERINNPEKVRERYQRDYRKHIERHKNWRVRYYAENSEKLIAYQHKYRKDYPEKVKATRAKTQERHGEAHNANARARRAANPELARTKDREYYANNLEYWRVGKGKLKALRHRARRKNLPVAFTLQDWRECLDYWHCCCAYCGSQQGLWNPITADHFIPISDPDCPGTVKGNMLPACKTCNCSKQGFEPYQWIKQRFGVRRAKRIVSRIHDYFEAIP